MKNNRQSKIQRTFVLSILLLVAASACNYGQYSPAALEATIHQVAATGIALTLTALPTSTIVPSQTPSATLRPSATTQPSETAADTAVSTSATYLPTWTPFGQSEPTDFVEDKTNKDDKNAPLLLDNQSGEEVRFVLLSPVYGEYTFTKSISLILSEGTYQYRAWIGDKGPIAGSFSITNGDKHVLTFYKDKIHFSTP